MNRILIPSFAVALAFTSSVFAGPQTVESSKNYTATQTQSPGVYGVGFYGAIQAGINAHQEYRDLDVPRIGDVRFSFDQESSIGGIVGGKVGYVFGTAKIRPAVELDAFYNGFKSEGEVRGGGETVDVESTIHSGAYLANFLVRFDLGRFQPYIGAGVGLYNLKLDDVEIGGTEVDLEDEESDDKDDSDTGWAWQIVAGSDYYFTEKLSAFLEYKYLNYETDGDTFGEQRLDQHIVALGLRLHF